MVYRPATYWRHIRLVEDPEARSWIYRDVAAFARSSPTARIDAQRNDDSAAEQEQARLHSRQVVPAWLPRVTATRMTPGHFPGAPPGVARVLLLPRRPGFGQLSE